MGKTLLEWITRVPVQHTLGHPVPGLPQLPCRNGTDRIQPLEVRFTFIGDRIDMVSFHGPIVGGPHAGSTSVIYDSWDDVPAEARDALDKHFSAQS